MPFSRPLALAVTSAALLLCLPGIARACEGPVEPCSAAGDGSVALIAQGAVVPVVVEPGADTAVKWAAGRFAEDLGRVGGASAAVLEAVPQGTPTVVIVGVAGEGGLIDRLARAGQIDLSTIAGKWEAFGQFVVPDPLPGVSRALVVAGSDRRGAIYGLFDLSERIGVSPWYWWADVPVVRKDTLFLTPGNRIDAPAIRYRGFFINDEDPALSGWAKGRFGGLNSRFYAQVFELLLRLKGNYIWPAMWGKSLAEDDPESLRLASDLAIVLGTSHHEPLTRAHVEWERANRSGEAEGEWDYTANPHVLREFWRKGFERFVASGAEGVITVGMRGDGDEAMSEETAIPLLERIVADQRAIIADVTGKPASETPQVWALYKEVQDYYDQGMRVPEDVILLFSDDNWGQIRRLPDPSAAPRKGGYGVYYHFDYVGAPRNYKWIDTNQVPKVWQQMNLAWERGARALWVVNVGDIKPMEYPLDFFLDMAWDPEAMTPEALADYPRAWAAATFGEEHGEAIGALLSGYGTLASLRKPELLDAGTFTPEEYGQLAQAWDALVGRAARVKAALKPEQQDAFFQLVEHRIRAMANLYQMYAAAAWNARSAGQDPAQAEATARTVELAFARDEAIERRYHEIAGGKWAGIMRQPHIGYTNWNDPPRDTMPSVMRGAEAMQAARAEDAAEEPPELVLPAVAFQNASGGGRFEWTRVPHLGHWGGVPLALPQGQPPTTPADGVFLEYRLPVDAGDHALSMHLVPALDTLGNGGLRFGLQIDDGPVEVVTVRLEPTGGAPDTQAKQAWYDAVIANEIVVIRDFARAKPGEVRVRFYRIDDNAMPEVLKVRRRSHPEAAD